MIVSTSAPNSVLNIRWNPNKASQGKPYLLPCRVVGRWQPGDLFEQEQKVVWATHFAPAVDVFTQELDGVAWRSKPTSYIVATNDRTVRPESALRCEAHGR